MAVLDNLEPRSVFRFFEEICAIPHGSGATDAISSYLCAFAQSRGLKYRRENCNNVIIWKEASPGYENAPTVMIQGHMDMVCEKEADCDKNMETEGLDLFVDGDLVGAKGTTLGGDDGIAVAIALAVMDDDSIAHGPLECLFTVDEEIGLLGAKALDASDLKASYMLNVDSEVDKVLTVSCAGSIRATASICAHREPFAGTAMKIAIGGLKGGHSGEEIHMGRANSNILMGRALTEVATATETRLVSTVGGAKGNAIPRTAEAIIVVADKDAAAQTITALAAALKTEYATPDGDICVTLTPVETDLAPMDAASTRRIAAYLFCVPNGVQNMSMDVPGLVQTSLNLGKVITEGDTVLFDHMLRSSVNSQNSEVLEKVTALCTALGGTVDVTSAYSAWEYQPDSVLRPIMIDAFRDVYGEEPTVAALHAGLECGIISGKMPQLDCISYGPDLTDIHTPRERLHIASTERIWKLTLETLKRLK